MGATKLTIGPNGDLTVEFGARDFAAQRRLAKKLRRMADALEARELDTPRLIVPDIG